MSLEASAMGSRSNMVTMLLPAGAIGPLIEIVNEELTDKMAGIDVAMMTGVRVVVAITLEGVTPSSYASDMRTGV